MLLEYAAGGRADTSSRLVPGADGADTTGRIADVSRETCTGVCGVSRLVSVTQGWLEVHLAAGLVEAFL